MPTYTDYGPKYLLGRQLPACGPGKGEFILREFCKRGHRYNSRRQCPECQKQSNKRRYHMKRRYGARTFTEILDDPSCD